MLLGPLVNWRKLVPSALTIAICAPPSVRSAAWRKRPWKPLGAQDVARGIPIDDLTRTAAGRCDADAGAHRLFGGTDERELVPYGIERRPAAGERQLVALMPAERLDPRLAFERDALVEYHLCAIR